MISIDAPYTTADSPHQLARIGSVSRLEQERVRIREAIAIEGYAASESRIWTALAYTVAGVFVAMTVAILIFTDVPSEADALRADAGNVRDAQVAAVLAAGARK